MFFVIKTNYISYKRDILYLIVKKKKTQNRNENWDKKN